MSLGTRLPSSQLCLPTYPYFIQRPVVTRWLSNLLRQVLPPSQQVVENPPLFQDSKYVLDTYSGWNGLGHVPTLNLLGWATLHHNKLTGPVSVTSSALHVFIGVGNTDQAFLDRMGPQMEIRHGWDGVKAAATFEGGVKAGLGGGEDKRRSPCCESFAADGLSCPLFRQGDWGLYAQ